MHFALIDENGNEFQTNIHKIKKHHKPKVHETDVQKHELTHMNVVMQNQSGQML